MWLVFEYDKCAMGSKIKVTIMGKICKNEKHRVSNPVHWGSVSTAGNYVIAVLLVATVIYVYGKDQKSAN